MPETVTAAVSKIARLHVKGTPDPNELDVARRELAEAKLERHIREVVAAAPPLTQEQRDRLAVLLSGRAR